MTTLILPNERSTRSLTEFEFIQESGSKDSKLGKGSFASVQLAKEKKSGNPIAIKIINADLSNASKSEIHNLQTEIKIHRELNHPNIVKFHDYIQEGLNIYLVLEYAPNGNLYSFMNKKKTLSPSQIFRFFYQSCLAIQYLHQKDILHRDLKPENLLLDKDLNIKLCDFGWAARSIRDKRTTFCGTYEYMAPEIVEKRTYDYRVDIWSLGILLYELVHGEAPYKGRSLPEIQASFAKGPFQFRSSIAPELRDLIQRILQGNPEDRISLNEILSHSWVKKNLEQSNPNPNGARNLDNLRSLGRTQTSRFQLEADSQYNPVTDKENLQGRAMPAYREFDNQASRDEIARALANLNHVPDYPDARRKIERPDLLPGLLLVRESNQANKTMAFKSLERDYQPAKNSTGYGPVSLIKTLPGALPGTIDVFNDYSNRPKYLDRSMAQSNSKLHMSEMDLNMASHNTTFDKAEAQNSVTVMKAYNNQKALDLLKKAESTRTYYFRPNYFEKNGAQQQIQYSSNLIVHNPPVDNSRINYHISKYPMTLKPQQYEARPQNDYNIEEVNQWKNQNIALKTETFRMGTQRMPHYESHAPSQMNKTGLSTLRSLPIISYHPKIQSEGEIKGSLSPYYNPNMPSTWHQGHLSVQPMGSVMSGSSSPLLLNERYQSTK